MCEAMLMELDTRNCWTLAEALGHSGPHRLQHFLARARDEHDLARDRLAAWIASELADDQAVLVVDETGDEKSSTDAVGAAHQYSGTLGGVGLCQVADHLTYASRRGHAVIDRELYLPAAWAADEERRLLTHVPDERESATKPQLAADMLECARALGIRVRWIAGDEVYGGRELRLAARRLGFDHTMESRRITASPPPPAPSPPPNSPRRSPRAPGHACAPATASRATATTTGPCSTYPPTTPPPDTQPATPTWSSAVTATRANSPSAAAIAPPPSPWPHWLR
ncbi:transposase [Streptomyces sp. NPDC001601]|uniref:IS701 family transposase n=1 Tax=Streptomyces sp. NPDC001601 TaxID=3364592 RepID=UPI00369418B2